MEELLTRGRACDQGGHEGCMTASEAERLVRGLRVFDLAELGSPAWLEQHDGVERLNLQAHLNAQAHADEFVKEAFVTLDRLTPLVQDLLVTEVWHEKLFPLLKRHLAEAVDSVTAYQLLYHEAALANLLEVLLYHRDACEAVAEEALLELCDWCCRKLLYLATDAHAHVKYHEASAQQLLSQSAVEDLEAQERELTFSTALCALTILRYLTEHMEKVSLGVMSRLAATNNAALALLPLLERPPWVRRGKAGLERYEGGKWQALEPRDRLRLTQQDVQVWLALYNLVVDPACRAKMGLTEWGREALFKLKRHFSEVLLDQLPVLKDLQRVIDELAFGVDTAPAASGPANALIVEQVPMLRAGLLQRGDWAELAEQAKREQFGPAGRKMSQQRLQSMLKAFELMAGLEGSGSTTKAPSGVPLSFKVEAYRTVKEGVWEWWATYNLDLNLDKPAEPVSTPAGAAAGRVGADENRPQQAADGGGSGAGAQGEKAAAVKGLRYRLQPLSEGLQSALPSCGKLAVVVAGRSVQASLELPASETRDTSALAPAVWVTVGSLAGEGLALQLKLKRLDKPSERDKVAGVWYPYVPVGGALSVREGFLD